MSATATGRAGAVELALETARQVGVAEDAAARRRRRQRIGGQNHRATRPCGALLRPALAVGEHQAGPVGAVLFAEGVQGGELRPGGPPLSDGVQSHYQLAGFGPGDPRPIVDAADAEAETCELVMAL